MSKVIDIKDYKAKKDLDLTRNNRQPLYVSHSTGKISGKEIPNEGTDFADRLVRIRTSLDRINKLMAELKGISNESSPNRK